MLYIVMLMSPCFMPWIIPIGIVVSGKATSEGYGLLALMLLRELEGLLTVSS